MKRVTFCAVLVTLAIYTARAPGQQAAPSDVVARALGSLSGLLAPELSDDDRANRLESFSGCFMNDEVKRAALLSFVLRWLSGFRIISEVVNGDRAEVAAEVKTRHVAEVVRFELVREGNLWLIASFKGNKGIIAALEGKGITFSRGAVR